MSYKKIITIMLVTVLLCTSFSMIVGGRGANEETKNVVFRSTFGEKLTTFFSRLAAAFPSLSNIVDKITKAKPDSGTPDLPAPGTPETPPQQPPIELDFQISLSFDPESHQAGEEEFAEEKPMFKVGEIIWVEAAITNKGKTDVMLEEMNVHTGSLDYFVTIDGFTRIHIVGDFLPTFPEAHNIEAGETYTYAIPLNADDNIHFGWLPIISSPDLTDSDDSAELSHPPYFDKFPAGKYEIHGQYKSDLAIDPSSTALQIFDGQLTSQEIYFEIVK